MKHIHQAGIVCCSNALPITTREELEQLQQTLQAEGIQTRLSPHLFAVDGVRSASAKQRAQDLMSFYLDPQTDAVFDCSGGDIANEILPYLDYAAIARSRKPFWGYSDLTCVLNAIYTMTGNAGVLYQIRHYQPEQRDTLFTFPYSFIQGNQMEGIVVGGNIRCLLKLAGTRYFPNLQGKILFLEARSGLEPQMIAFLSQLQQLGAFDAVNGILLGTFTHLERHRSQPAMEQLIMDFVSPELPVAKTPSIGHAPDSRALVIGRPMQLKQQP